MHLSVFWYILELNIENTLRELFYLFQYCRKEVDKTTRGLSCFDLRVKGDRVIHAKVRESIQ